MLANPPYGKSWKSDLERMGGKKESTDPRFVIQHAGDPEYSLITRSSDGQMLFLANMLSKMKHDTPLGSRIAEVHNGSSLFTGDAGQGESNIRRWIIENDWLEAIVALPLNMFYNTGIATYVWVLTNRKPEHRQGQGAAHRRHPVVPPAAQEHGQEELRTRRRGHPAHLRHLPRLRGNAQQSKIFPNAAFGYWKVKVERPLRLHSQLTRQRDRDPALRLRRRGHPRRALRETRRRPLRQPRLRAQAAGETGQRLGQGDDDEEDEDDEADTPRKSLPDKKKKEAAQRGHLEARRHAARGRHTAPRGTRRRSLRGPQPLSGTG